MVQTDIDMAREDAKRALAHYGTAKDAMAERDAILESKRSQVTIPSLQGSDYEASVAASAKDGDAVLLIGNSGSMLRLTPEGGRHLASWLHRVGAGSPAAGEEIAQLKASISSLVRFRREDQVRYDGIHDRLSRMTKEHEATTIALQRVREMAYSLIDEADQVHKAADAPGLGSEETEAGFVESTRLYRFAEEILGRAGATAECLAIKNGRPRVKSDDPLAGGLTGAIIE